MTNLPHNLTISAGIPLYKGDSVSEVKTRLRLIADEITAHAQRDYGSLIRDSQSVRHFVSASVLDSEIDYEFQGKDFGYARTVEELELALDEADAERNDPEKWITPIEFHTRLEDKYPWLK